MSKKIILRQSVKSGVAVVFFFGLGMASINAQTTQTTQPTGKVGINTTNPTETLDVKGKVRIQELYTDNQQTGTNNNATFTATNVVTVDNNGVLGKKLLSDITAAQTPNLPWKKVGTTENAVPAGGLSMYSRYAVGIGEYGAAGSKIGSSFEINEGGTTQLGLINTKNNIVTKWHISTEDRALTFTKRKPEEGRIFSLTQDAKLYLANGLTSEGGGGAKITLDGNNGNIILIDKWRIGLKENSLMFYNSSTTGDSDNKFTLTNKGKLFLGKDLNGDGNGTGANILLSGDNGRVAIGKNSADYNLDVKGDAKISGLKTTDDNITNGSTTKKYAPAKMVVVDDNGVLGKQDFPTIPTMPTIPTEPWQVAGSSTQANANNQNIYQSGKVGIGSGFNTAKTGEGNTDVTIHSQLEISSTDNGRHLGLINGDLKWDLSAEDTNDGAKAFSITKRHYTKDTDTRNNDQGRVLSLTKDAKLFLGNTLRNNNGDNAKILVDGGEGKVAIGKNSANYTLDVNGNTGIKGRLNLIDADSDNTDFLLYSKGTQLLFDKKITVPTIGTSATQTGVTAALTNVGKLYLGSGLTSSSNNIYSENAKILLDGQDGKVAIGHNNPAEALDVKGKAKIQTIEKQTATTGLDMVVVGTDGVLKKAAIPTSGGSGNGVKNHTGSNDAVQCNAANAGTIHYKEEVLVNNNKTSVMGFCMKTAGNKYRWFYIFGGAGTTTGSEDATPNFGEGIQ